MKRGQQWWPEGQGAQVLELVAIYSPGFHLCPRIELAGHVLKFGQEVSEVKPKPLQIFP